jgi:hypothetical protein
MTPTRWRRVSWTNIWFCNTKQKHGEKDRESEVCKKEKQKNGEKDRESEICKKEKHTMNEKEL